jgi:PhzF family phenazine biosynthesis protein
MSVQIWQVDSFTTEPFRGNPAGVCLLQDPRPEIWMQQVALEMNLSETAFLHPEGDGYRLRWFTPVTEVRLCGHATLASAHVLYSEGRMSSEVPIRFMTLSGVLTASRVGDRIALDFPARPPRTVPPPADLVEAVGFEPVSVLRDAEDYLLLADSESRVRSLSPDLRALASVTARGVIVTAPSDDPAHDFVSRFFAPRVGVDEDPVTGSSHCCLAPFWGERLGKTDMTGYQASSRGGTVYVRLAQDRVILSGHAVTTLRGELTA